MSETNFKAKSGLFRKQLVASILLMVLCLLGHIRWVDVSTRYVDYPEKNSPVVHQKDRFSVAERDAYWVENEDYGFNGRTYTPRFEQVYQYKDGFKAHLVTGVMLVSVLAIVAWFYSSFMLGKDMPSGEEFNDAAKGGLIAVASFHVLLTFRFATYVIVLFIIIFVLRSQNRDLKAEIKALEIERAVSNKNDQKICQ